MVQKKDAQEITLLEIKRCLKNDTDTEKKVNKKWLTHRVKDTTLVQRKRSPRNHPQTEKKCPRHGTGKEKRMN